MIRFQAWAAGCLILIGAGLALFSPGRANSQAAQSVLVTNTTTQPVPVSKSGAWNVGISGVPTVKLDATTNTVKSAQSGLWNVGITAAGNTVRVGNAKTSPVPVYDARDAQTPFHAALNYSQPSVVVPSGKRLVIEYIGLYAAGEEIMTFYRPTISTTTGGLKVGHYINAQFTRVSNAVAFFHSSQATRLYADPNTAVSFSIDAYGGVAYYQEATVSGYLVPYP